MGADMPPPPENYFYISVVGGETRAQKLSAEIFNSNLGNSIFKRYQTEHNFEMI